MPGIISYRSNGTIENYVNKNSLDLYLEEAISRSLSNLRFQSSKYHHALGDIKKSPNKVSFAE